MGTRNTSCTLALQSILRGRQRRITQSLAADHTHELELHKSLAEFTNVGEATSRFVCRRLPCGGTRKSAPEPHLKGMTMHSTPAFNSRAAKTTAAGAVVCMAMLLSGGQSACAAFSVTNTAGKLSISGPITGPSDSVLIWGTGTAAEMQVWDTGSFAGLFSSVKQIHVDVWGANQVSVWVIWVKIQGAVTILR